jgi:hypothetical protein
MTNNGQAKGNLSAAVTLPNRNILFPALALQHQGTTFLPHK